MKVLSTGCWAAALGLATVLATPSTACANDTGVAKKAARARAAKARAAKGAKNAAQPVLPPEALLPPLTELASAASAALPDSSAAATGIKPTPAAPAPRDPAALLDDGPAPAPGGACTEDCPKPKSEIELLPEVILENLGDTPVLGAFVTPVTEGITIETGEGLPAVKLLVKPTKITRGSGLVAVGTF